MLAARGICADSREPENSDAKHRRADRRAKSIRDTQFIRSPSAESLSENLTV
jgi:hypothetical protein